MKDSVGYCFPYYFPPIIPRHSAKAQGHTVRNYTLPGLWNCRQAGQGHKPVRSRAFYVTTKVRIITHRLLSLCILLTFPCITLAFSFSTTFFCDRYFLLSQRGKKRGMGGETQNHLRNQRKGSSFMNPASVCRHWEAKAFLEKHWGLGCSSLITDTYHFP